MPYEIIKRTQEDVKGIQLGKKKGLFRNGVIRTNDASLARDINAKWGQDREDGLDSDVLVAHVPDRSKKITTLVSWDGASGSAWKQSRPWLED